MHSTSVAASILALGMLLGGLATSGHADTPDAGWRYAAVATTSDDNNGNG